MFVCLFVFVFVEEDSEQYTDRINILDNEVGHMFVCLFVCVFVFVFVEEDSEQYTDRFNILDNEVGHVFVCLFVGFKDFEACAHRF